MKTVPYIISPDSITAYINGVPHTARKGHPNFEKIELALYNEEFDGIEKLFDIVKAIGVQAVSNTSASGSSSIVFNRDTGLVTYKGYEVGGAIVQKLLALSHLGVEKPVSKLVKFMENLYENPSSTVISRLYTFIEKGQMPITEDGCFLAYKRVRADWKDVHSGTIDNSPGAVVDMPRSLVNDNDAETCSTGLHFCSYDYLKSFSGARVVSVKINPRDVVSIPVDYNDTKGRCCKYMVMEEITSIVENGPVWSNATTPTISDPSFDADDWNEVESKYDDVYTDSMMVDTDGDGIPDAYFEYTLAHPTTTDKDDHDEFGDLLRQYSNTVLAAVWNRLSMREHAWKPGVTPSIIDHFRSKDDGIKRLKKTFHESDIRTALNYYDRLA
jgi:hypothetical protein